MSADDVELVRRLHEAWNRGEDLIALGLVHEDFEYVNPPYAIEPGTRSGWEGWQTANSRLMESWEDVRVEVEDIVDAGDRVAVFGRLHGRGRGSGVPVDQEQSYVWTLRDGRAVRFEWYFGHEAARRVVG